MVQIIERFSRRDGSISREDTYFAKDGLQRLVLALITFNVKVDESSPTRLVLRNHVVEVIFEGEDLDLLQEVIQWRLAARDQESMTL